MLPKETLYAMYEEATREPYSFWMVNLRAPKEDMFWVRFDRKFIVNGDGQPAEPDGGQAAWGEGPCARPSATTLGAARPPRESTTRAATGHRPSSPGRSRTRVGHQ